MVFPDNDPCLTFRGKPTGMQQVLKERGLLRRKLLMKYFKEQRSLVQEVIENAGHICLFLPKYHCKINFIEYFWGAVKRCLREHCNYTFATLKENMPKAMASVSVQLIRKWKHRVWRFIDAYKDGLGATDAQRKVKEFSSRKYKSHQDPCLLGLRSDPESGQILGKFCERSNRNPDKFGGGSRKA
ncbi:hypothetical protein MKEN_01215100 [Mycena kentingensis (nom. inval.)]|nr:hypothetical protein MKEN_01215100 [Mycena kentingensis (nom. inval.)]